MGNLQALSSIASIGQAATGIASGFSTNSAAGQEAGLQEQNAQMQMQQAVYDAQQKAREVTKFAAMQSMQYAGSGVTLEGSPLLALNETRTLGQQEINQIWARGKAQELLGFEQAAQTRNQGRNALIGSFGTASQGVLNNYVKQKTATVKSSYAGPYAPTP